MFKPSRRLLAIAFVFCSLLGAFGIWVLLHPASIWVQPWRVEPTTARNDVIFGPYPVEEDFVALKGKGVTTIVSLLNPDVPYEKVLLAQERERASRHGMQVLNFPMGSILGQSFGSDYDKNSRAAAHAARDAKGIAYIHCYLGMHRARNVQKYLDTFASSSTYAGARTGNHDDVLAEARATEAFKADQFALALSELAKIRNKNQRATRLEAWTHYRLRNIDAARAGFERVLQLAPDDVDALTGLAYCALSKNQLTIADTRFAQVLSADSNDAAATEGLAHVRFREGKLAEAKALFERAANLNPGNAETRQMLERIEAATAVQ